MKTRKRQQKKTKSATAIVRISKRGGVNEGRPPLYDDPVVMDQRIAEYFAYCDARTADKVDSDGNTVTYPNPQAYTIMGLVVWLGFHDMQGLDYYALKPEFSVIVKKAKAKVESWWEARLGEGQATGAIFWLKNRAAYRDRQELAHSGSVVIQLDQAEQGMAGGHTE